MAGEKLPPPQLQNVAGVVKGHGSVLARRLGSLLPLSDGVVHRPTKDLTVPPSYDSLFFWTLVGRLSRLGRVAALGGPEKWKFKCRALVRIPTRHMRVQGRPAA